MDNNRDNQISQAGIEGVMLWTHYFLSWNNILTDYKRLVTKLRRNVV